MKLPKLRSIIYVALTAIGALLIAYGHIKKIPRAGLIRQIHVNSNLDGLEIKCMSLNGKRKYTVSQPFSNECGLDLNDNFYYARGSDTLYTNPNGSRERVGFISGSRGIYEYVGDIVGDGSMYYVSSEDSGIFCRKINETSMEEKLKLIALNKKAPILLMNSVGDELPDIIITETNPKQYVKKHIYENKGNRDFKYAKSIKFLDPMYKILK